jgi:endonuclease/exonuclease/phosphatase family metal-dependent hydrolase
MRLATFNVENLFRRPVVLDQPTWADGRAQLNDYTTFNGIISKASYSSTDKQWLVDFLDRYDMADRRIGKDDPFQLNEVRGKLFKVPRGETKAEIIVDGRGDWDGWLELRRHNVNHVAIENTARVVEALNADVLAVVEAEDRIALQRFNDSYLLSQGVGFIYNMLIDGNAERGIDVGIYSKQPIRSIHSNIGLGLPGEPTFSRDCAEFEIETPAGDTIWVLVNHFKSKGYGSAFSSNARRGRQAKAVAEIYRNRVARNPKVAVVGDLNDTPDSTPLAPLIQQTDLEDVMSHPLYVNGNDRRPGTYSSGAKSNKIDYILLSPALWATVSAVGVERRGVWAPRTFPHFPEIGSAVEAASDHAAVWVDLP